MIPKAWTSADLIKRDHFERLKKKHELETVSDADNGAFKGGVPPQGGAWISVASSRNHVHASGEPGTANGATEQGCST